MTATLALLALFAAPPRPGPALEKKPAYLGIQIGRGKEAGVVVVLGVLKDGPAEKGGLRAGDFLLKIDGAIPPDLQTAVQLIRALEPGKKAKFLIRRDGKESVLELTPETTGG